MASLVDSPDRSPRQTRLPGEHPSRPTGRRARDPAPGDRRGRRIRLPIGVVLGAIWILTRLELIDALGLLHGARSGSQFQDVVFYHAWWRTIVGGHLPSADPAWQYPPGAAFLLELPGALGSFDLGFVLVMLLCDLIVTIVLVSRSQRSGNWRGASYWVCVLPLLGVLSTTRFDLVPTVLVVLAGTLSGVPLLAGMLLGAGAFVKIWPVIGLLLMKDLRDLKVAAAGAAGVLAAGSVASALAFHSLTGGFLAHEAIRGLQVEAVAASGWFVAAALGGHALHFAYRSGSMQFVGPVAHAVADVLGVVWIAYFVLVVFLCARQHRRGAWSAALGRDATWTVVLGFIVTSRVASPQYLIWMVGLGALVLSHEATRLRLPILLVTIAAAMTILRASHLVDIIVPRNLLLVAAFAVASGSIWRELGRGEPHGSVLGTSAAIASR